MSSEASGVRPLTKSESPTTNVRTPSKSRCGSRAAMAAGMAGRGRSTTQAPSKSVDSYAVMAERGPAEPSRRRSEETTSSQASVDRPSGAWAEWHAMSDTSRPSMPGWRPGRMT
eukprot:15452981-Alexandrium_andersonii.AAC.1